MTAPVPAVTVADALDDCAWFDGQPSRRFRARRSPGGAYWLVRKRGDVFLRTFTRNVIAVADTDAEVAAAWFSAVWSAILFAKANRKSRQAGVRRAGGRR